MSPFTFLNSSERDIFTCSAVPSMTCLFLATIPVLFEYCLGYHQGVTRASRTPGTTTYNAAENSDSSVTVAGRSTPGTYNRGGQKTSTGTFFILDRKFLIYSNLLIIQVYSKVQFGELKIQYKSGYEWRIEAFNCADLSKYENIILDLMKKHNL